MVRNVQMDLLNVANRREVRGRGLRRDLFAQC